MLGIFDGNGSSMAHINAAPCYLKVGLLFMFGTKAAVGQRPDYTVNPTFGFDQIGWT